MLRPTRFTLSRLAARQTRAAEHPDADLLEAFREQSLTAKERSTLMSHLACCSECREVLSLVAASPEREKTSPAPGGFGIAWSKRRWAAAALAAVCLLLIVRSERNPVNSARRPISLTPASQPAPPVATSAPFLPNEMREENQTLKMTPKQQARLRAPVPRISLPPVITVEPPNAPVNKELDLYSRALALQGKKTSESELRMFKLADRPANAEAQETGLRDSRADDGIRLANSQAARADKLIPQTGGLYSFAPAAQSVLRRNLKAKAFTAPPTAARWSLTGFDDTANDKPGALYRSQDEGQTWTEVQVAPGIPLTALATAGSDIWAGGVGGALYHSSDNGHHWDPIAVADEQERLTSPITRIDIPEAGHIILKVHSGRDWISVDNGQHWTAR